MITTLCALQDRGIEPNVVVEVLTVVVLDVNDQNPAFQLDDYFAEVHENLTFVRPQSQMPRCYNYII